MAAEKLWDQSESDLSFMLDVLKWLEGPSPKESESDREDDPEPVLTPEEIAAFENGEGAGKGNPGGVRVDSEPPPVAPGTPPETSEPEAP